MSPPKKSEIKIRPVGPREFQLTRDARASRAMQDEKPGLFYGFCHQADRHAGKL